ncbi:Arm DNA-binding domain-containing protein [Methylophilus sp. Leaf408]|nr:Arm DNA-binding domain-containing protein [Methylophilus sp. Leaf408]
MALTDTALRNAKPADKPFKLYDEKGLFVIVNPNGVNGGA